METTEFYKYFHQKMEESQANFYWELSYDENQRVYECFFMLESSLPEDASYKLMDVTGRVNTGRKLLLADRVAFYDSRTSFIDPDFYLKAFEIDEDKGVEKGFLEAFIKYLHQLVNDHRLDLDDFLEQDRQVGEERFVFAWQDENFEQTAATLKDTRRYDFNRVTFETIEKEEKNFIQKLRNN